MTQWYSVTYSSPDGFFSDHYFVRAKTPERAQEIAETCDMRADWPDICIVPASTHKIPEDKIPNL